VANYHYVSHSPIFQHCGNLWHVNAAKSGLYTQQLKSILDQLEAVLSHCSQVLVLRFDIRTPEQTNDNRYILAVIKNLSRFLKQNYQMSVFGYHWAREQEKSKSQHYHVVFILDANKVNHPSRINDFILEMGNTLGVQPWIPKNCYYRFKRNEYDKKQGAIWRMSYLAKARGKGYKPAQTKNHGSSRVKPKL
jgi:hypothetical protein